MEVNLSVTETFVHVALGLLLLSGTLVAQDYVISTVAGGTSSTPGNMAGSWQFSGQSSIFGIEFSATGQIVQVGNAISGQLAISGTPCATSAAFTGTVSATGALTINLNENGQVVVFSGTLASDGNSASGTYGAPSGGCTNGDTGTWSGQRLPTRSGIGDGGLATQATLDAPYGVAGAPTGGVYIAEVGSNETDPRVRKVSSSGIITTVAGNGTNGYAGDGGPAINALLDAPFGVWADSIGDLYIADTGNERVRKVSPNGTITTVAGIGSGSIGQTYPISGVPATSALLYSPWALTTDSLGNLYIAQGGLDIVSKVSPSGIITTVAGNTTRGYSGDGGSALNAELHAPSGVAVDSAGNVFIADSGNARIRKVSSSGIITTVAGNGTQGYAGDGEQATSAELQYPSGIAIDFADNLYIADLGNNRIRKIASNGIMSTIAGNGVQGYSGDGGSAPNAELNRPNSLSVDSSGNVFVADTHNNVIRLLTPAPAIPQIDAGGVVNGASYTVPVAPGSIAAVFGDFFLTSTSIDTDLPLDTSLQNLSFQFSGGTQAPLYFASGAQVDLQVPWELAGQATATLAATLNGQTGVTQTVNVAAVAPAIFSMNSQGTGQGAILDSAYHLVDSSNPVTDGTTIILIYCTGLGPVTNQPATGSPGPSSPLAETTTLPTVTIGGTPAGVLFSGLAPGYVGLYQVNALVLSAPPGQSVPVTISIRGVTSNTVTIAVQ